MNVEQIAKVAHEANRAYCEVTGDKSQPAWENAPAWQRQSAIDGVKFHKKGDKSPEDSHNNWLDLKKKKGWVYGIKKDPDKKTHPCIAPYSALPQVQRLKDSLFVGIVHALTAAPEKDIRKDIAIALAEEIRTELSGPITQSLTAEIREDLTEKLAEGVREELKESLFEGVRAELKEKLTEEVREEIKADMEKEPDISEEEAVKRRGSYETKPE